MGAERLEALPCPFCAASPRNLLTKPEWYRYVTCAKCGANGPFDPSKPDAIAAWNKRAPDPEKQRMREALETIRGKSAPCGYDSGDSGIYAIADAALPRREGKENAENSDLKSDTTRRGS
jgi:Lar family restriction alleviation protein